MSDNKIIILNRTYKSRTFLGFTSLPDLVRTAGLGCISTGEVAISGGPSGGGGISNGSHYLRRFISSNSV